MFQLDVSICPEWSDDYWRAMHTKMYIHKQPFEGLGLHESDHPGHGLIYTGSMSFVIYTHLQPSDCKRTVAIHLETSGPGLDTTLTYTTSPNKAADQEAVCAVWQGTGSAGWDLCHLDVTGARGGCTWSASASEFRWAGCFKVTSAWLLEPKNIALVSVFNMLANQCMLIRCSKSAYTPLLLRHNSTCVAPRGH